MPVGVQGGMLGSGWSAGFRVECWVQGGVLDSGWNGSRVECWVQGGVLGSGWSAGFRVECWVQGGVLGSGWRVGWVFYACDSHFYNFEDFGFNSIRNAFKLESPINSMTF
ncbi:hypothetical protein RRG08_050875 [Elysia crispata]|uniref:Uncharacterized protein n=1 Tax=Elysia crispata TaxID=231223 RepID=A0AAE1DEV1_9GAST|nr:hypothetical protein RRG08_050875 [Elysia crispata]